MIRRVRTGVKKIWAQFALLSIELLIVFALVLAAIIVFLWLVRRVIFLNKTAADFKIFDFLQTYVSDVNTNIMLFFTFLGTHNFLIPANIFLIIYFLFIKKHRWYSIKIPTIAISTTLMMFFLKNLFDRPRPDIPLLSEARGLSFPSGHAMCSMAFYGLMIYIVWQKQKTPWIKWTVTILLSLLILIIGFSRIYLRVHYPTDVLAGFCVGLIWLVLSIAVIKRIEKYSQKKIAVKEADPNVGLTETPLEVKS